VEDLPTVREWVEQPEADARERARSTSDERAELASRT
jgi:hypothetical protein